MADGNYTYQINLLLSTALIQVYIPGCSSEEAVSILKKSNGKKYVNDDISFLYEIYFEGGFSLTMSREEK